MTRPTRERLERIIEAHAECTPEDMCDAQPLIAEVRALQAVVERVEKLPLKWMDYVVLQTGEGIPDCAKDLEEALRGET